jgi:hypothetical protein
MLRLPIGRTMLEHLVIMHGRPVWSVRKQFDASGPGGLISIHTVDHVNPEYTGTSHAHAHEWFGKLPPMEITYPRHEEAPPDEGTPRVRYELHGAPPDLPPGEYPATLLVSKVTDKGDVEIVFHIEVRS